jgi:HK97 family phage portal protein
MVKAEKEGNAWWMTMLGEKSGEIWGEQSYEQYIKYFIEVPEVNAIINYRARAESMVNISIVSKSTGEEIKNNEPLIRILRNPNWLQTQTEFFRQTSLFRSIFGNEYLYLLTPTGRGTNYRGLFTLPSQNIYVKCKTKRFYLESELPDDVEYVFKLDCDDVEYPIDIKDLIHLSDNRITYLPDKETTQLKERINYLYGTSPLASLTPAIKNIRVAYEARNILIENRGAIGILSNDSKDGIGGVGPMNQEEKIKLQNDWKSYGLTKRQWQIIITNLSLRWQQISMDIDKLKLFEEIKEDTMKLCDVYGVPYELLGNSTGVTYENKKEAKRQMYQDAIIPSTIERIGALNKKFDTENKSWEIIGSFDHLPIFQENIKERAQSITLLCTGLNKAFQDGAISIDDYKKELSKFGIGK